MSSNVKYIPVQKILWNNNEKYIAVHKIVSDFSS